MTAETERRPPELSDAAWEFLEQHARRVDGEFLTFEGDWGNWNWLWTEVWKRCAK